MDLALEIMPNQVTYPQMAIGLLDWYGKFQITTSAEAEDVNRATLKLIKLKLKTFRPLFAALNGAVGVFSVRVLQAHAP